MAVDYTISCCKGSASRAKCQIYLSISEVQPTFAESRVVQTIGKPLAIGQSGSHRSGKVWIYSGDLLLRSTHQQDNLLQATFRKDLMTSVHIRLLRCLEQYQTAQRAREFRALYLTVLMDIVLC